MRRVFVTLLAGVLLNPAMIGAAPPIKASAARPHLSNIWSSSSKKTFRSTTISERIQMPRTSRAKILSTPHRTRQE